jgi:Alpha amylase, catalytic domain
MIDEAGAPHLVDAAHSFQKNGKPFPIRIILDVVINHSGDNWFYQGGSRFFYFSDQIFPFGDFRRTDRPIPAEFRNQEWYHRRGEMRDFDHPPENQHGDIVGLKDYANDDDAIGSDGINALIKVHAYWIREADVDGFRVDAVKHMGELASSRFCSNIREYAYSLGKRGFFSSEKSLLPQMMHTTGISGKTHPSWMATTRCSLGSTQCWISALPKASSPTTTMRPFAMCSKASRDCRRCSTVSKHNATAR